MACRQSVVMWVWNRRDVFRAARVLDAFWEGC